jgi:glycosyltransferase involved in cell wall biosynthesis
MHYCFFTSGSWQGNASVVRMRELGNEFIARGHRVSYLVDDVPYNRQSLNLHPRADVVFTPNPTKISQVPARRSLLKKLAADFVHVLNPFVKAYLALAASSQRVVGDWDEWPAMRTQLPAQQLLRERFLDRWMRNRSTVRVVCSRYLQREFERRYGQKSVYIPYAMYLPDYPDGESPYDGPTAVYMGTFYPAYDHDLLLGAAKLLKQRGQVPKIALVGAGIQTDEMARFIAENGLSNVQLCGQQRDEALWRHLRHARVLLFPIRETILNLARCPSKTFAYVQAQRPVIANRVGEVAEVLGEKAFRYPEPTAESFADAIAEAMQSPATEADVSYDMTSLTWSARADTLLAALEAVFPPRPVLGERVGVRGI